MIKSQSRSRGVEQKVSGEGSSSFQELVVPFRLRQIFTITSLREKKSLCTQGKRAMDTLKSPGGKI